jgi:hypothetical protein
MRRSLILLTAFALATPVLAQGRSAFSVETIRNHIEYLSSDALRGRGSGDKGNQQAAQYVAQEFAKYGLKPLGTRRQNDLKAPMDGSGYFQPFQFVAGRSLGRDNHLKVDIGDKIIRLRFQKDFQPSTLSAPGEANNAVVFVGYGITAPNVMHDDYKDLNVKGKTVLLFAGSPGNDAHGPLGEFSDLRRKAMTAREKEATAIIVVLPKNSDPQDLTRFENATSAHAGIPILRVSYEAASKLLGTEALADWWAKADKKENVSRPLSLNIDLKADVQRVDKVTANIIGLIEGSDPVLKNEYIVIGAHMDHLGLGGFGSLAQDKKAAIHHGADDNASGTTGVLSLAAHFGGSGAGRPQLKRSLILMCYSGEELGLLGSAYYVTHPILPLEKTTAMLNMDMIGRMKNGELIVGGTGSANEWATILDPANQNTGIRINKSDSAFGASDHFSFYNKKIPVLFFFTGLHSDYHTPTDTAEKINYEGEEKIIRLVAECATRIADLSSPLTYQAIRQTAQEGSARGFRVYVGSIPSYSATVEGVQLEGVRADSPAAKAGLKAGDIIIKFGKATIKSVEDYTVALQDHKPGDVVEVIVKRGNETVTLSLTLAARRSG